jgi:predicted transcriptional regulator
MSLRKIAKILGISPAYLSLLLNNKRPWRGDLKERYDELVNTFVNTQTIYKSEKWGEKK